MRTTTEQFTRDGKLSCSLVETDDGTITKQVWSYEAGFAPSAAADAAGLTGTVFVNVRLSSPTEGQIDVLMSYWNGLESHTEEQVQKALAFLQQTRGHGVLHTHGC